MVAERGQIDKNTNITFVRGDASSSGWGGLYWSSVTHSRNSKWVLKDQPIRSRAPSAVTGTYLHSINIWSIVL